MGDSRRGFWGHSERRGRNTGPAPCIELAIADNSQTEANGNVDIKLVGGDLIKRSADGEREPGDVIEQTGRTCAAD